MTIRQNCYYATVIFRDSTSTFVHSTGVDDDDNNAEDVADNGSDDKDSDASSDECSDGFIYDETMILRNDFGVSQYALLFSARELQLGGFNEKFLDDGPAPPQPPNSPVCVMLDDVDEPTSSVIEKLLVDIVSTIEQK